MTTIDDAKSMARYLRAALELEMTEVSHSRSLELVSKALGYADWNTCAAVLRQKESLDAGTRFTKCSPILRIFDEAKARQFYCGFLGFTIAFEHRFEPSMPLYMGIERAGLSLHLSEHHGDASPGSNVFVVTHNVRAFHEELLGHVRQGGVIFRMA